jgi:hypothetical protein
LYLECQKNLEKEKNKKDKFLNLILAFENDIKKMEFELNICQNNDIIDKDSLIDKNVDTQLGNTKQHENAIEKIIENIQEYKHEKTHENIHENIYENNIQNIVENGIDSELNDIKINVDSSEIIDTIPRPTTPQENIILSKKATFFEK